jgi:hypothetical protein
MPIPEYDDTTYMFVVSASRHLNYVVGKTGGTHGIYGNFGGDYDILNLYTIPKMDWLQLGTDIDGEFPGDQSGTSVSLSSDGNIVAIGGPFSDVNGTNIGQVRVYQYENSKWEKIGDISGEAPYDRSGWSVSLSSDGHTVAIGAPYNNRHTGHVRVYRYDHSQLQWIQIGLDIDGLNSMDESGLSVSLNSDGTAVAIGT